VANLTDSNITVLLEWFQPWFFFDPTEQFFPAVAEEILAHEATESWNNLQTHQRGTAVLLAPLAATSYAAGEVQAGVDDPNGAPLTFNATAPEGIGQPFAYNSAHNDLFVDCAGWDDTAGAAPAGGPGYTTGSVEYLQPLFSALANAMNARFRFLHHLVRRRNSVSPDRRHRRSTPSLIGPVDTRSLTSSAWSRSVALPTSRR
jgi:hypothetical protein